MESQPLGKKRNPLAVAALSLITLNAYYTYWYYKVNEEIGAHSENIEVKPWISAVAVSAGSLLIIPPYFSAKNLTERLRKIQREESLYEANPSMGVFIQLCCWVAFPYYVQSQLNEHWDFHVKTSESNEDKAA